MEQVEVPRLHVMFRVIKHLIAAAHETHADHFFSRLQAVGLRAQVKVPYADCAVKRTRHQQGFPGMNGKARDLPAVAWPEKCE